MTTTTSGNLELFETEFLKDFKNINITAVADYYIGKNQSLLITGDSTGVIRIYERKGSKLTERQQQQKGKTKIDKLIVNSEFNILYILTGGSLFIHELPNLKDISPKESDGESRYLKDVSKIIENEDAKNKNELMIIKKKKKLLFFFFRPRSSKIVPKRIQR